MLVSRELPSPDPDSNFPDYALHLLLTVRAICAYTAVMTVLMVVGSIVIGDGHALRDALAAWVVGVVLLAAVALRHHAAGTRIPFVSTYDLARLIRRGK